MNLKHFYGSIILAVIMTVGSVLPAQAFPDTRQHWAGKTIDHLHSRELVSGYPDGKFYPDKYITREEFATLLIQALGEESEARELAKGESHFADIADRWSEGFVELAWEKGIVNGDGGGIFSPTRIVTREEAVSMLVKAIPGNLPMPNESPPYSDYSMTSDWARESLNLAASRELIHGFPDNTFRPRQGLTRAQTAAILEEFLDLCGQKYHFYGELTQINLPLRQAAVQINGNPQVFELSDRVVIYNQSSPDPVKEIALPARILFDVNRSGKLSYAMILSESQSSQVTINLQKLEKGNDLAPVGNKLTGFSQEANAASKSAITDPAGSLDNSRAAMQADAFTELTGATGVGQLVAVIDSGIDAGHPDLQTTPQGYGKIVDYLDFTDEGLLQIQGNVRSSNDMVTIDGMQVSVKGINNNAINFAYAYLDLNRLPIIPANDLPPRLLVVLTSNGYFNEYDTVYLDSNGDGQIVDETPLQSYGTKQQLVSVQGADQTQMNLVVCEISNGKRYVKFGFDALGHGTEVAGIVSASGTIKGVAPGAQILALKILDKNGEGKIASLYSALQVAAGRGARVAVVSLGQYSLSASEKLQLGELAKTLWKDHHMLICMAAGNDGPGLNTVSATAALPDIISVGAYATPAMWKHDYGWQVARPTLWYFSSAGPAGNGSMAPMVVAPGNAVSTFPLWSGSAYRLGEGTSMAVPHVAGAVALLMDAAAHSLYKNDTMAVYQAVISGAQRLEGYQPAEQGFGAVNLLQSWSVLKDAKDDAVAFGVRQYSPSYGYGNGLYARGLTPAQLFVKLQNNTSSSRNLAIGSLTDWIRPSQFSLQIPEKGERTLQVDYQVPDEPGLYSDFLIADDMDTPGVDLSILQSVIVPYKLKGLQAQQLEQSSVLGAAEYRRYFIQVPEGAQQLSIQLTVPKGRVRLYAVSPSGWQDFSSYAGQGLTQINEKTELVYNHPEAGTWEIIVYSSAALSDLNLTQSQYTLQASLKDYQPVINALPDNRYIVSCLPRLLKPGENNLISLGFWNASTKTAGEGVVMIDGRMYELHNGMVLLSVKPAADTANFTVSW